jgi:chromosome segregation ATPase
MLNPLAIPSELWDRLRAIADAVEHLPAIEQMLDQRLTAFDSRMESLPEDIERALRPHFERQQAGLEKMLEELVNNREAAETLPGKLDALRADIRGVLDEIATVRETLEPLEGPARRLARVDEVLPGGH